MRYQCGVDDKIMGGNHMPVIKNTRQPRCFAGLPGGLFRVCCQPSGETPQLHKKDGKRVEKPYER